MNPVNPTTQIGNMFGQAAQTGPTQANFAQPTWGAPAPQAPVATQPPPQWAPQAPVAQPQGATQWAPAQPAAPPAGFGQAPAGFGQVPGFGAGAGAPAVGVAPPQDIPSMDALLAGIGQAKVNEGGNYHRAGHYIEQINNIKPGKNRKGRPFIAFEMRVLHVFDNSNGGHISGENVTHLLMQDNDMFLPNLKKAICNLSKTPYDSLTDDMAKAVLSQGLLRGMIVEVFGNNITTRDGNPFTVIDYRREIPAADLLNILTPEEKVKFYPNGELEKAVQEGRTRP